MVGRGMTRREFLSAPAVLAAQPPKPAPPTCGFDGGRLIPLGQLVTGRLDGPDRRSVQVSDTVLLGRCATCGLLSPITFPQGVEP